MELEFYVADLVAYNEGILKGEWLNYTDIALTGFSNLVADLDYEEWEIHDSNCRFSFDMLVADDIDDLCKKIVLLEDKNNIYNDEVEEILFAIAKEEQVSSMRCVTEIASKLYHEYYDIRCVGNCVYHPELELAHEYMASLEESLAEQGVKLEEHMVFNHIKLKSLGDEIVSTGYFIKTSNCNTYFIDCQ